jgi:hypothetical protein
MTMISSSFRNSEHGLHLTLFDAGMVAGDGDQQTNANRSDVDEEISPRCGLPGEADVRRA